MINVDIAHIYYCKLLKIILTCFLIFKSDNALLPFADYFQYSFPHPFIYIPLISPEMNFVDVKSKNSSLTS